MSLLGDEKASERRFKITGKYTGGVGSSGKWTPLGGNRFGNDWEAEARYYANNAPQSSLGDRLAAAKGTKSLGSAAPEVTVKVPEGTNIKSKAVAVAKEAIRKKAKSILSPRAESEKKRLEGLFTT